MNNLEIASAIKDFNMIDLAMKTNAKVDLNEDEKAIAAQLDEWAREIGNKGRDNDLQIAQFVSRVVNDSFANYPSEILDSMFDRGSIGEDDTVAYYNEPKNTLKAIECAQGGNVERSFLDVSKVTPVVKNLQVETDISFVDLRRNGWKTVSLLSQYAVDALNNALYHDVFSAIDAAIVSGNNYINGTSSAVVTQALADALSLYVHDWAESGGMIVGLSKYIQQISKLAGYSGYMSDEWKSQLYRTGFVPTYDGISLYPVAANRTLNNDGATKLMPDKRVFGIAGKIGAIDMIGDVHTYQQEDINTETIHIKVADFKYARAFYDGSLEKCAKIALQP